MVGLALEVQETAKMKKQIKQEPASSSEGDAVKTDVKDLELALECTGVSPQFIDVFHYAFCYVGVLTGKDIFILYANLH